MKRRALSILFAAAFGLAAAPAQAGERPLAPKWELRTPSGRTVRLSDYQGKVVVLNFWATYCGPCRREIPELIELQRTSGPAGVVVVGVSVDLGSTAPVAALARQLGVNYPIVMVDAVTMIRYGGIEHVPTTFVIDRAGRVAAAYRGQVNRAMLEADIKPLL